MNPSRRTHSSLPRIAAFICAGLTVISLCRAQEAEGLKRKAWQVDGVEREALIFAPPAVGAKASPLVFVFHGHGGNMGQAARSFHIHTEWPEAIVVYPQGLNTPGQLTDPEGKKSGWQGGPGAMGDRDLKFFDTMLAGLKEQFKVDGKRVFSTGHSNGGGFTYLLWGTRGEHFTAMAPSAAAAARTLSLLKPKPVLHLAGETDPLVKFEWQTATMAALRRINQCGEGAPWKENDNCTHYPSAIGAPVVTAIHPGGHQFHREAPRIIVTFFKTFPGGA